MVFDQTKELLRPHQIAPTAHLLALSQNRAGLVDLSDTGTGKTYVTSALIAIRNEPTLVVVPKISVTAWRNVLKRFGAGATIVSYETLRTGRHPAGEWDNTPPPAFRCETFFKCTSCQLEVNPLKPEPCYAHPAGIHCVETKKKPWKYGDFNFHPGIRRIVFDEAHRCSGNDSLNADMLIATVRNMIPVIGISATLAGSPLHLKAWGYALGLHNLKNFLGWTARYKCGKIDGMRGWHWKAGQAEQPEIMAKISKLIIPDRGVRVRTDDIPGFPKRVITAELYDIEDKDIDHLYEELEAIKQRGLMDKDPELGLTKTLRLQQELEMRKVPLMIELTQDSLAKGRSVGLFIRFAATMARLRKDLKCDCYIDGSNAGPRRDKCIADYQENKERVILVNTEAGGLSVSLQDLTGNFPRDGYLGPNVGARTFQQLVGRFHREGGKSTCFYKVLLAAGTVEEKTHKKLQLKLTNLDALNDSDFTPFGA